MQNIRDRGTGRLFDEWKSLGDKRLKRLKGSWAEVFRSEVLERLPSEKIAQAFDPGFGRPTVDIPVVIGALILQQMFNLTDRETADSVAFNLSWHYALDVQAESDLEMTDRTLRNYRRLVIDLGLDEVIFRDVTEGLIRAFNVDTAVQRMDSTGFKSAMRELTRLGTFVETVSKFIRELKRKAPSEYERVDPEVIRKYVDREGEGCFGVRPVETGKRLPEAAEELRRLLDQFAGTEASELESYRLMERVFREQCEVMPDDSGAGDRLRIKDSGETGSDILNNPSDPDSAYNAVKGQGYIAQVMETYTEADHGEKQVPDIITYVKVNKMTEADANALKPALHDVLERGLLPESMVADTPYGAVKNQADAESLGVKIVAPAYPPNRDYAAGGNLTVENFELDENGFVIRCPAGVAPVLTKQSKEHMDARFDGASCAKCHLAEFCPCGRLAAKGKPPKLIYRKSKVGLIKRRLYEKTNAFKDKYRWRAGIEATISRLKHRLGLARIRVRGRPAVTFALFFKALGLNIWRCGNFIQALQPA